MTSRMALWGADGQVVDERAIRVPQVRDVAAVVPDLRPTIREEQKVTVREPLTVARAGEDERRPSRAEREVRPALRGRECVDMDVLLRRGVVGELEPRQRDRTRPVVSDLDPFPAAVSALERDLTDMKPGHPGTSGCSWFRQTGTSTNCGGALPPTDAHVDLRTVKTAVRTERQGLAEQG